MTKLLKRLGFVHNKPKCVPAKADATVPRAFVDRALAPLMAAAGPSRPLYFVDGTHPAYTGHPAFGWIVSVARTPHSLSSPACGPQHLR